MSTTAAGVSGLLRPPAAVGTRPGTAIAPWAPAPGEVVRLVSFASLSALAAMRYAMIETRPPLGRVLAVVGAAVLVAMVVGAAPGQGRMVAGAAPVRGRIAATLRLCLVAVLVVVALLIAGLPPRLLWPGDWGQLASHVGVGIQTLANATWPYAGTNHWARLDILVVLCVVPTVAAALAFWPGSESLGVGARRAMALGLLVGLFVVGVIDSNDGSGTVEGLLLLCLLAGCLWLPALAGRRLLAGVAWIVVAGALSAALAGPIASTQSWFDYRAWNLLGPAPPSTFAWDQTYGPIAWPRSQRTMFTVQAGAPGLWKVTTLDRFDGLRFVRSGTDPATSGDLPLPLNDRWYRFAAFTIAGFGTKLLPTEDGTTEGVNSHFPVGYGADGTVSSDRAIPTGTAYSVMSYVPQPTPAEMRAAPRTFPAAYLRYTEFDLPTARESGLRLAATDPTRTGVFATARTVGAPSPGLAPGTIVRVARRILASPYGPMYRLARRITAGSRTAYDAAMAIQTYLEANYAYGVDPPARRYPLEAFLFQDRVGYCQQFSGAMALMLRMVGIPARVAVGFHTGTYDSSTRSYRVSARDAHSWVEVFFTGIGWVAFDPTPPPSNVGGRYFPLITQRTPNALEAVAATIGGPPPVRAAHHAAAGSRSARAAGGGGDVWLALGAAALLGLVGVAVRWGIGRARLSCSLEGDGELAARELVGALRRLGYQLPAPVTLAQVEQLVGVHGGPEAAQYVRVLRERRYAPGGSRPAAWRERRRLRSGLTRHLGLVERLRGQWALPPGTLGGGLRLLP
jgi:protein-glutamine gamma-glutamyltransferase